MFRLVRVFIAPDVGTGNWLTGVIVFFFRDLIYVYFRCI